LQEAGGGRGLPRFYQLQEQRFVDGLAGIFTDAAVRAQLVDDWVHEVLRVCAGSGYGRTVSRKAGTTSLATGVSALNITTMPMSSSGTSTISVRNPRTPPPWWITRRPA